MAPPTLNPFNPLFSINSAAETPIKDGFRKTEPALLCPKVLENFNRNQLFPFIINVKKKRSRKKKDALSVSYLKINVISQVRSEECLFTCPFAPAFMYAAPPTVPGTPAANSSPENPSFADITPKRLNGYPLPTR
ncbi:hypothetical protein H5410_006421 [Solanum commersonii]|uniref:Uncharacterized protein n=1 Tax=Solanum commersonii TaxID=4109 RepID=A0A9J6AA85_SOLCO|nr:hypothetical protein H5410_006421 [Solanum commersonii]